MTRDTIKRIRYRASSDGYIPSCVYQYDVFKNKTFYSFDTQYPVDGTYGESVEYKTGDCPVAEQILASAVKMVVNEFHTERDLEDTIAAIKKVSDYFCNR